MAKTARGQITITSVSDGASAWVADLYNQVDSVSCDETGHPVAQQMVSTPVRLFYGNTEKTFTAASPTPLTRNGSVIQFDSRQNGVAVYLDGNELKVTYYTDAQISGKDDFAFTLQATEDATVKRTVHFIVNGVKGDVYNLKPSVDEIHATRDTSGNYLVGNQSTYNLSCGYTKRAIDGTVTEYANVTGVIDSKYCVYFRRRNRSTQAWDSTYYRYDNVSYEGYVRQLALNTYDAVEFVLSTSAAGTVATPANIIDRETVNVLADGVSGKDAPQVLFEPSVLYVDADSDGKSTAGNKTFNVTMSLVVNGTQKTVSSVETSVPSSTTYTAVNASYSQQSGALTVTVLGSQSASKWDGAFVKATLQGGGYTATGLLPIVSKRKGATGDNAVEYKFVCEPEKVKLKGGVYTPSTVKVQLHRIEGGNDTVLAWADLPSGMTIQKSMNNSSWLTVGSTEFNSLKNGMGSSTFFDVGSNQNGTVFFRAVQNNVVKATASFALLADGEQGLTGKAFYMSGQWDSTVEYVSNDWECPLVWVNTQSGGIEWYYLPTGTSIDQDPRTANPNPWQKADNYYKVIITEAIFADFASFGSAVINGDWMISQHGKYNDGGVMVEKGVMNENDNTTYWLDNGVKKPYYMKFAENDPTATVYDHFAPDFALDLKTGTLYGKKMNISGTIHAENFFHRICFFDGTNYSNPCYRRTSDYVDGGDSFVTGEYYTLDDIESISGNNLHGETGFVQSTGSADIVVSFFHEDNENNEPSYRNHVNLPNPDKYEGKKVQLYSYNIGQYNGEMYELWLDDQNRSQIAGAVSKLWPDGTVEVANNTFYSRLPIPIGGSVELVSTKVHKTNPNDYGFDCVWLMLENRSGGDIIIDGGGVIPTSGVSSVAGLTGAVSAASLVQNISTALTNAGFRTTDDNSTYKLTLNGSQKGTAGGADLGSFYAPIAAGSNGQFLKSTGSGAPSWSALPTASTSAAGIVQLGTGSTQAAKGDHNHDGTYQPVISDLATIRNNAANGNTAFGWGNHASAGYALASALSRYLLAHGMSTENNGVNDFFVNFPKDDSNTNAMDVDFQGGASYNFDADVYIGNKLVKVVDDININASNSAYTQIKIAKLTVASSGLRTVSFTALLSTCETTSAVYDKNSHLLHLLVRRESSGSASYDFTITQFGENAPGNAYVVRDGNNTFYVYIDKESGLYAPYYVLTPLMTKGDVEFMNTRESLTEEAKVAATKAVVLGYHTHTNKSVLDTITEAMITKLNGIEAGANKYTHPTNGANTTIAAADGRVLSAITVNNLGHVTSVSYKALSNSDIPSTLTLNALAVSGSIGGSSADFDSLTSENATVTGNLTVKGGGLLLTYPFTKVNGDAQTTPAFKTYWRKIGSYTFTGTGSSQAIIELFSGDGYNGNASQNSNAKITLKHGWQQADSSGNRVAENSVGVICERYGYPCEFQVRVEATGYTTGHVWILVPVGYGNGFYRVSGHGMTWTHNTAAADTTTDPTHNQKAVTYYDYQKKLTFVNTKNNETVDGNSNSFSAICFPFTKSVDGRITLDLSGISANIPTATSSVLGGVKVGDTLAISSGVLNQKSGIATAGTYTKVAVDTYGRVTAGTTLAGSDIPNISATKIAFDKLDAARLPDLSSVYLPNRDIKVYQGDKAVDYIKVATVRITGTGLTNGGFSAIFSSFSIVEKNSFILNLSIRREALTGETPSKYDFTIMPTGTVKPRGAWVTRTTTQEDNTTVEYFDVYIGKRSGYWAPYYMMHPFQTDGNVTFCNEPAASISNIVAEAEYGGIAASAADADTVDGKHASEFALATDLNGYLAKTGGDVRGVVNIKGQLNLQDASGNTKIALFGSSGSLYIGGTTDNYLAATHKWVEDKGYEANVINTVKVNGSTLTVSNKAVDIQRASENAAGVVIIGDGLKEDNDGHLTLRLGNGLEFETVDSLQTVAVSFGTTATTVAAGNHNHSGVYQPVIGDLDSIRGNASRGNMAYRWGNHADAGYQAAITSSTSLSVAALTSKNGISVGTPTNNAYPVVINSAGITINGNSVLTSYTEQYTGTVTKVEMATASGSHMSVSGSPVTSSGKFTLSVDTGYAIPTTAKQTNWDTAYTNNHTHSNKAVLDGITSNKVSTWDGKQPKLTFLNTKNNNAEAAFSNLYLPLKDVSSGYATLDLYAHPAGANTTITAASKKVLSAITVDSYGHVTSVSSKSLTSADIPDLSSVYLPLSGGTLTGNLDSKINTAERGVTPNSSLYRGIYFRDKNSKHLGQVESSVRKDGQVGLSLMVARPSADDVLEYGGLYIYKTVGQTGNKQASYNANTGAFTAHSFIKSGGTSSQFLKADGSVDSNQYALASTVLEYFSSSVVSLGTSGNYLTWTNGDNITETITVPYATNADTLDGKHASDFVSSSDSVTKNYILAGPASGNASSPSFRALVAADIPNLTGTYVPKSGFFYSSSQWNSSAVTPNGIQLPLKLVSSGIYAFDMLGAYNTAVKRIYGMPTPQTGSDRRDYVRIATLTASDSGLSVIGFSAILMSTELLRKNSFILNVSIRRESTFSNTKCECVITPIGTVTPPNLYIRSSDYKTFYVYIDKKYNLYDPYFDLCPLYSKNVTFESEAVSSLPSGSSFSAQAEIGGAAPKLYTARSLWGQNFDGTADVSGDMTGVGNITASGKLTVNGKSSTRVVAEDGTLTATSISAGTWSLASSINVEFTSSTATVSIARAEPSWPTPTYSFDGPVVQSSDSRLKTIEKYLEPSVYDIAFAPLVAFRWKNGNGRQNVGTLAQYWEKVLPQAVHEDGDGFLSLEYSTIALAAGVTASRKAVDNERRILELEREVSALKTRVAELEQEEIEN